MFSVFRGLTPSEELRGEYAAHGKTELFDQLEPYLLETGDYRSAAASLRMTVNALTVALHRMRQRLRKLVREEVIRTVGGPEEVEEEMRHLHRILER